MDSNDVERAMLWYEEGHKLGLQEANITPERKDLWDFRLENAEARAASHLTDDDDPQPHIAKAKAILEKGTNPQQAQFLPSLEGYVAFYTKDYKGALGFLQQANQNDPFIQCLLAMTYEKLGDNEHAMELYKKAATATNHNPAAAFAVPRAKRKVGAK
jgi:tetratricopeptide (TPR) repeat protein